MTRDESPAPDRAESESARQHASADVAPELFGAGDERRPSAHRT